MASIYIVYKLQVYIKFFFAGYKNGKIEVYQKV